MRKIYKNYVCALFMTKQIKIVPQPFMVVSSQWTYNNQWKGDFYLIDKTLKSCNLPMKKYDGWNTF